MMPRLVLGGRFGQVPVELSFRLLDQFRAAGGRMLETAHSYANGDAERVLGAWLRSRRCRDTVTVVDKVGHPAPGEEPFLQPDVIRREVADSLRRLGTDCIDVLILHRDDPSNCVEPGRYAASAFPTGSPSGSPRSSPARTVPANVRWSATSSASHCRRGRCGLVRGTPMRASLTS